MDDQTWGDLHVIRQTVVHIHTLAFEHGKRTAEIHRHVRDIKYGVVLLIGAAFAILIQLART